MFLLVVTNQMLMVIYVFYVMSTIAPLARLIIHASFASLGTISTHRRTLLIRFASLALLITVILALLMIFAKFVTSDIQVSQTALASNASIPVQLASLMELARRVKPQIL